MLNINFKTIDEGMNELKRGISIRNQMGGAMYWNILNDECCKIANIIVSMGGNKFEIAELIGEGNYF